MEADRRTVWFRCEQIIQRQTELLCEMANRCVPLIDEFAATFCNLSLCEITASGPATTAQARVRFINCGDDATFSSDDKHRSIQPDPLRPRRPARWLRLCVAPNSDAGKASPAAAVEIVRTNSRRDMAESSAVVSRPVGLGCCRRGVAKEFSKRCVRHNGIGVSRRDCIVLREAVQCGVSPCAPSVFG